jgi:hypothetical protein
VYWLSALGSSLRSPAAEHRHSADRLLDHLLLTRLKDRLGVLTLHPANRHSLRRIGGAAELMRPDLHTALRLEILQAAHILVLLCC